MDGYGPNVKFEHYTLLIDSDIARTTCAHNGLPKIKNHKKIFNKKY